jgi:hypothetical protein
MFFFCNQEPILHYFDFSCFSIFALKLESNWKKCVYFEMTKFIREKHKKNLVELARDITISIYLVAKHLTRFNSLLTLKWKKENIFIIFKTTATYCNHLFNIFRCANFANILRVALFVWKLFSSYSLLTVWICNFLQKNIGKTPWRQFHQCSTSTFCACRSWKRKKDWQLDCLFCAFRILSHISFS